MNNLWELQISGNHDFHCDTIYPQVRICHGCKRLILCVSVISTTGRDLRATGTGDISHAFDMTKCASGFLYMTGYFQPCMAELFEQLKALSLFLD